MHTPKLCSSWTVLIACASRIWKFVKTNLPLATEGKIRRGHAFDLLRSQQASSFVRPTAVCSATFCRDQLLLRSNPYRIISAVTALQAATQLEAARRFFCVLGDEHLPIDVSVELAPPAAGTVYSSKCCFSAALFLAATS